MRTPLSQQTAALQSAGYEVRCKVTVRDTDGTWQDLSTLAGYNWVDSVSWDNSIDQPVGSAEVLLFRQVFDLSLSTLMTASKLNKNAGGSYSPLLHPGRQIKIETFTGSLGEPVGGNGYDLMFHGEIDEVDWSANPIRVSARDMGAQIQDCYIEVDSRTYGHATGYSLESQIQDLLDDNLSAPPTLYVPSSPGWNLKLWKQRRAPLMDAIRTLVNQIGWDCRYKYRSGTAQFELTLYGPDRSKVVPDFYFSASMYRTVEGLRINRAGIRNVVRVIYAGSGTQDTAEGKVRVGVERSNSASITKYGRRFMEVAEAGSSNIDTQAEAEAMADAMLADLKDPTADFEVAMPYFFPAELGDLYRFYANGIHFDSDQDLAVYSIRHTISATQAETRLQLRGKPAGQYKLWHDYEARPGKAPSSVFDPVDSGTAIAPSATGVFGGVQVSYHPSAKDNPDWQDTEIHLYDTPGETLTALTRKDRARRANFHIEDIPPGTTKYGKLVFRDTKGNRRVSDEFSAYSKFIDISDLDEMMRKPTRAKRGTDQTLENTDNDKIDWNAVDYDAASAFDTTNSRWTCPDPWSGVYRIGVQLYITGLAPGDTGYVSLYKDGSPVHRGPVATAMLAADADTSCTLVCTLNVSLTLSVDEYVEVYFSRSGSATASSGKTVVAARSWFTIERVPST